MAAKIKARPRSPHVERLHRSRSEDVMRPRVAPMVRSGSPVRRDPPTPGGSRAAEPETGTVDRWRYLVTRRLLLAHILPPVKEVHIFNTSFSIGNQVYILEAGSADSQLYRLAFPDTLLGFICTNEKEKGE